MKFESLNNNKTVDSSKSIEQKEWREWKEGTPKESKEEAEKNGWFNFKREKGQVKIYYINKDETYEAALSRAEKEYQSSFIVEEKE